MAPAGRARRRRARGGVARLAAGAVGAVAVVARVAGAGDAVGGAAPGATAARRRGVGVARRARRTRGLACRYASGKRLSGSSSDKSGEVFLRHGFSIA